MKWESISVKSMLLASGAGAFLSMTAVCTAIFAFTGRTEILWGGLLLTVIALLWIFLLALFFRKRLNVFAGSLCRMLDDMMDGTGKPTPAPDAETVFAKISHRLARLYDVMQENRRRVDGERRELQELVTDISHQVKMPVSNLKMVADTLLSQPVTEEERTEFLLGIRSQAEKLDFLVQALIKTSRLETGAIRLQKKRGRLYDTLAEALSGIVYAAERKGIAVSVSCPENLELLHDAKWTAEALFNLLDNAVKYTPEGGEIRVTAEQWEMYIKVDVTDNGRGIPESRQAAVFRRFYREEEVHGSPGAGVGLFLAREIVSRQGGYIKVSSKAGVGSTFSVFLPVR